MKSFLIITTKDLPEAYFLAAALESRRQRIGVINITGRPLRAKLRVLGRLRRNRGLLYLADLVLARTLRWRYMPATVVPFPEIDEAAIAGIKQRWPSHSCLDPHAAPTLQFVRDFAPDYIVLAGTPVLKPSLFSMAREGAFNRHLGMLPDYKGSDCPVWALALNDAEHVGFTIHRVAERVDGGDVLHVEHVPIAPGNSFVDYLARLQRRASETLIAILDRVIDNAPVEARAQRRGGRFVPPAGLRVLRRARENFDRLAHGRTREGPPAPEVVTGSRVVGVSPTPLGKAASLQAPSPDYGDCWAESRGADSRAISTKDSTLIRNASPSRGRATLKAPRPRAGTST
jgi:folate-dependent phosphoribosylglycinamide formyltransferase PurN